MRLINRITIAENLNAKAKDLAPFLRMYEGCLMTAEQYRLFVKEVKGLLDELNAKHVRTKPFEVYGSTDNGIYIVPEGICPVDNFELVNTVDYDEAGC